MSGEISFPLTLSELEQGETLGCGFNVGEVWDAADFGDAETRNKIEGEWIRVANLLIKGYILTRDPVSLIKRKLTNFILPTLHYDWFSCSCYQIWPISLLSL